MTARLWLRPNHLEAAATICQRHRDGRKAEQRRQGHRIQHTQLSHLGPPSTSLSARKELPCRPTFFEVSIDRVAIGPKIESPAHRQPG